MVDWMLYGFSAHQIRQPSVHSSTIRKFALWAFRQQRHSHVSFPNSPTWCCHKVSLIFTGTFHQMTCRSSDLLRKCWYEAIFIRRLSNCCCRQWWRLIVEQTSFSAPVNFLTAQTLNIPLLPQLLIFTKTAHRLCRG